MKEWHIDPDVPSETTRTKPVCVVEKAEYEKVVDILKSLIDAGKGDTPYALQSVYARALKYFEDKK